MQSKLWPIVDFPPSPIDPRWRAKYALMLDMAAVVIYIYVCGEVGGGSDVWNERTIKISQKWGQHTAYMKQALSMDRIDPRVRSGLIKMLISKCTILRSY